MVRYKETLKGLILSSVLLLMAVTVHAQQITVQGTVTDAQSGKTLVGVNILVKGTSTGTATDAEGKYSLNVSSLQDTLRFSYIGYKATNVPINGRTMINISLEPKVISGQQLVVTGYGTQKKANLTASVSHINAAELDTKNVTSLGEALAGKVAGVQIQQTAGAPGGAISINIRGTGSINAGNAPLYVVNGVPLAGSFSSTVGGSNNKINPLASLNSADIKSIDILKGASATSIYGSRGANGVVLITTKQGARGEAQFDFRVNLGWQTVAHKIPIMSKEQYVQEQIDSYNIAWASRDPKNSVDDPYSVRNGIDVPPLELQNPSSLTYTNWQDALYRGAAPKKKYSISASGGSENLKYYLSTYYQNINGLVENSFFKSYGMNINLDGDITDHIHVGINIIPTYASRNQAHQSGIPYYGGVAAIVLSQNPLYPIYDEDGTFSYSVIRHYPPSPDFPNGHTEEYGYGNAIGAVNNIDRRFDHFHTIGNTYLKIDFLKHFSLKSSISGDFSFFNRNVYHPSTVSTNRIPPVTATASSFNARRIRWDNKNLLKFKDNIKNNNINVLLGLEFQKSNFLRSNINAQGFPNDRVHTINAAKKQNGTSSKKAWTLMSYFGRVSYNYANKYLVKATLRRDGSSRFGVNNKWGLFPSGSVGWRINEEPFMDDVTAVSNLKLRVGYGITGNNSIGNYAPIGRVSQLTLAMGAGPSIINGLYQSSLSNPRLTWEKGRELDIGLDLGLFNGRLTFTGDIYNKINNRLLLNVNLPYTTGYGSTTKNVGKVRNRGVELSLNTINFQTPNFSWSTNFNFSINRNEVLDLNGTQILTQDYNFYNPAIFLTKEGLPIGSYYGYVFQGVYINEGDFINHAHFKGVYSKIAKRDNNGDIIKKNGVPVIDPNKVYFKQLGGSKFKDINGDGYLSTADKTVIGDHYPDFIYGFSSTLNYKNFSFSFSIQAEKGGQAMFLMKRSLFRRKAIYFKNYWRSPQHPGGGQTLGPGSGLSAYNLLPSSWYIVNTSFFRINSVNLGYQLPHSLLSGILRKFTIFLNVRNLYTFTPYIGYNPQTRSGVSYGGNNTIRPGLVYGAYPLPRTFSFGIDVGF